MSAQEIDPVAAAARASADQAPPMPDELKRRVAELLRPTRTERKAS